MKHVDPHPSPNHPLLSVSLALILLQILVAPGIAHAASKAWEFQAAGKIIGAPLVTGETIYIAGGDTVYALDHGGRERWHRRVAGDVSAAVTVDGSTVYVHSSGGLHALDDRGQPLWTYEAEDLGPLVDGRTWGWGAEILADPWGWYRSAPASTDDLVIFGSSDGVHAVERKSGVRRWRVPVGPVTADVVVHGDLALIACWNHSVYALDIETGKVRWRFRATVPASKGVDWIGYQGFHLTPRVDGDRVFVGNRNTNFYALNVEDGSIAWNSKVGASWMGSPAVASEQHVFYGLSDGQAVLGHRKDSGALSHFFRTGSLVFAQPALHRDQLIVGTLSGHLFSIDTISGEGRELAHLGPVEKRYAEFFEPESLPEGLSPHQKTEHSVERMLTESNSILNLTVVEGRAYVGTGSGRLYALTLEPPD